MRAEMTEVDVAAPRQMFFRKPIKATFPRIEHDFLSIAMHYPKYIKRELNP